MEEFLNWISSKGYQHFDDDQKYPVWLIPGKNEVFTANELYQKFISEKETNIAKLRNQLSPLYGLSSMILALEDEVDKETKDELFKLIIKSAKQAEQNCEMINILLKEIGKQLND